MLVTKVNNMLFIVFLQPSQLSDVYKNHWFSDRETIGEPVVN